MDKPETLLTVREGSCWAESSPLTVRIQRRSDGTLWIVGRKKISIGDGQLGALGSTIRTKRLLTCEQLDSILERLKELRIPACPEFRVGLDGGFTELVVGDCSGKAHYRWWWEPPEGWEPLNELAQKIIRLSGLPARIKNAAMPRRKREKKRPSLTQLLTNSTLSFLACETIFERGVAYRHDGMVNGLTVTGDAIAATVMGGWNYQAKFWWATDNTLAYSCTCPFFTGGSGLCKHLVALGLEWLDQAPGGKNVTPEPQS